MLDYVIRNGMVVDGTGGPARRADVGIRDGRIVAVGAGRRGRGRPSSTPTAWWWPPASSIPTPTTTPSSSGTRPASPSNLHGVTTVIGGNCGFTLAPIKAEDARLHPPDDGQGRGHAPGRARGRRRRGTGRPSASTSAGSRATSGVNAGFLVGHCALRRWVMGADAGRRGGHRRGDRRHGPAAGRVARGRGARLLVLAVAHPLRRRRQPDLLPLRRPSRDAGLLRGGARPTRAPRSSTSPTAASTPSATRRST